jgi:hypothetical protein
VEFGEQDSDRWVEVLSELIYEEGEDVFRHDWDSGGPGAGANSEIVYRFRDLYWPCSSVEGLFGPTETLQEALKSGDFLKVTSATTSIHCTEIGVARLAKMLEAATVGPKEFVLNGASWQLTAKGRFNRVSGDR